VLHSTKKYLYLCDTTNLKRKERMKKTVDFLNNSEKLCQVKNVAPFELPKSFIVCMEPQGKVIYISPVSVGTILKRIEAAKKANFN
jgi:hypothetical protein